MSLWCCLIPRLVHSSVSPSYISAMFGVALVPIYGFMIFVQSFHRFELESPRNRRNYNAANAILAIGTLSNDNEDSDGNAKRSGKSQKVHCSRLARNKLTFCVRARREWSWFRVVREPEYSSLFAFVYCALSTQNKPVIVISKNFNCFFLLSCEIFHFNNYFNDSRSSSSTANMWVPWNMFFKYVFESLCN